MKSIKKYRKKIDKIDSKLIKLLEKRLFIVNKIKEIKKRNKLQLQDIKREREILEK